MEKKQKAMVQEKVDLIERAEKRFITQGNDGLTKIADAIVKNNEIQEDSRNISKEDTDYIDSNDMSEAINEMLKSHSKGVESMMKEELSSNPLDSQIGGNHYKDFKLQPVEFIHINNIPFIEGCCIKYLCRHRYKNGKQDLEKAKHFIDLLIKLEYGDDN